MINYELFAFPKNARVKNKKLLADKKGKCELCKKVGYTEKHHVKTRGSGGDDKEDNLIELCNDCHYGKVHPGKVKKEELLKIINRRKENGK